MTLTTQKTLRRSLLLLMMAATGGYMFLAWSFPAASQAQAFRSAHLADEKFYDADWLETFYQARNMRPLWVRGYTSFQPRADGVLKILEESWSHGLNPDNYHVERLRALRGNLNEENRRDFDVLMSDAVIRYVRDLTGMRGLRGADERSYKYWREPMEPVQILSATGEAQNPVKVLQGFAPTGKLYHALRKALIETVREADVPQTPIKISRTLKPGQKDKAVPALRAYFGQEESSSALYDDALAADVIKLQRRYGQKADGVLRAETIQAINRGPETRIFQILANMERLRWIGQDHPDRYVLVNIPSASLWAVEKGDVVLEMPVIVGKTARPTYSFKTEISGVRFNPNWTVPPTIKNVDFLPALQQDPTVLTRKGIRLMYQGKEVDPATVDWSTVTPKGLANVRMVQAPGDDNPLGKVRVIMENPYNIYLHDTNHREMFDHDDRTLSSGCIRVSQPEKLADFILKKNEGWTWNGMQKMIDSGRMRDVPSEEKIPVYITYQTIWLDSEGQLIFGRDVYGQDAELAKILKKSGAIHIPQGAEISQISL